MLAPSVARRSASSLLQQLLRAQNVAQAPEPDPPGVPSSHSGVNSSLVPYLPRIGRSYSEVAAQRFLPSEISPSLLSSLTIPEEGKPSSMYLIRLCF